MNRFAAYLEGNGVLRSDSIAVMTTNSPEMLISILALSKIGAIAGLINTNLRGKSIVRQQILILILCR